MAVMLIGATALATDNAFADGKKKYGKNQATSQANACGNGKLPYNVFCQNIGSQVQGEENAVAVDGVQSSGEDRHAAIMAVVTATAAMAVVTATAVMAVVTATTVTATAVTATATTGKKKQTVT